MAKRIKKDPLEGLAIASSELKRSELDLFVPPKGLDPILSHQEVEFAPIGSLDNFGPVVFTIPASTEFTDLSKIKLFAQVRVQTIDGKRLETITELDERTRKEFEKEKEEKGDAAVRGFSKPDISVPNDFFDCLFRRITLEINAVKTGSDHHHHPQIAVLKNILSYPKIVANANLKNALIWKQDIGNEYNEERRIMAYSRYKSIAGSQEVQMVSTLSHDMFNSTRLLPPGHSLKIRLERSTPEFCLIRSEQSGKDYKVKFEDLHITILRVRLAEHIIKETDMHYRNGCPIYMPFTRTDARSFEIPAGTKYYKAQSLFSGVLPERAIFVFCEPDCLGSGNYVNNPVIFPAKKFKVSQVQFLVDEREVLNHPYKPDWENKQYRNEYQGLLKVLGLDQSLVGCGIDYDDFKNDYGIFAVSLRGFDGKETGNISVTVRFENATTEPISGLLIPEFRSCLMIDSDRNVTQSDY